MKLFDACGKTERIKNLLIRNARRNPGNGHYYELRRYYFNLDEGEIEDSPVLMVLGEKIPGLRRLFQQGGDVESAGNHLRLLQRKFVHHTDLHEKFQ